VVSGIIEAWVIVISGIAEAWIVVIGTFRSSPLLHLSSLQAQMCA
jgi:hypothetical protein